MLKRNRAFVAKILFFFFVYYLVTYLIGTHSQEESEKLVDSESQTEAYSEEQEKQPEHKLNPLNPIVKDGPKVPELNKEVFDKLDHIYDGDVEIKKDEEHAAEPPPKEDDDGKKFYEKFVEETEKDKEVADKEPKIEDKLPDKIEEDKAAEEQRRAILPPKKPEGPGELGKPFKVDKDKADEETKQRIDKGWQNNAYNEYVSDLISVHRSLPDLRDDWCKAKDRVMTDLPQTSVIVCFHNEAWSVLLRSVHSILNRSPENILLEIILVDDASTMDHLKKDLEDYMAQYPKVKIFRAPERVGLIRARLLGAAKATAPVLTFLDSHIECTPGWLEPLVDRIARNATHVVCPVIDVIDTETLEYQGNGYFAVGGFDWNLQFNWHAVPEHENKRRGHSWAPAWSPTMAGGLFSIDKNFFERLGTYDNGFDIWGAENLELSFKTWMCGGTLEIIPCSHVGHIFRKRSPYKWRTNVNVVVRNSVRLAEVWLDEYKDYYYNRIGNNLGEFGDVSSRKKLRDDLECKSFKWYLDTIFPELFIPGDAAAQGYIRNIETNICIDSSAQPKDQHKPVGVWPCHNQGGNQYWLWSKTGEIRRDDTCLDYTGTDVILYPCHGSRGNQWWTWDSHTGLLKHAVSRKCLTVAEDHKKLNMAECEAGEDKLRWDVQNFNSTLLAAE